MRPAMLTAEAITLRKKRSLSWCLFSMLLVKAPQDNMQVSSRIARIVPDLFLET